MTDTVAPAPQEGAYELARISDRFLAFLCDLWLFVGGYYLTLIFIARQGPKLPARFPLVGLLFWAALFLLYHAYFAADERQTVGKRLLGIKVYTAQGAPLSFKQSLLRALGYGLSSLFFNLGFLWAFFRSDRAGWHDLLAGTRVVDFRPKGPWARMLTPIASWGLAGFLILLWAWPVFIAPNFVRMRWIAHARSGLDALAKLEEKHHQQTGTYTSDLGALARVYGNQKELLEGLPMVLDISSLRLAAGPDHFLLEARALDRKKTLLRLEGSARRRLWE